MALMTHAELLREKSEATEQLLVEILDEFVTALENRDARNMLLLQQRAKELHPTVSLESLAYTCINAKELPGWEKRLKKAEAEMKRLEAALAKVEFEIEAALAQLNKQKSHIKDQMYDAKMELHRAERARDNFACIAGEKSDGGTFSHYLVQRWAKNKRIAKATS